jgi:predicted dehydrogenase
MRFGLLGTGPWAAGTQAVALAAHEQVELIGVWGRNPAKAAALAEEHGARGYADVDALIADVDAVAVALPPDVQAELALRAAEQGRHLVLDKPVALGVAAADALVAAVDEHDLASLVFTTRRYVPSVVAFIAEAERAGGWYGATAVHHSSIFQPGNPFGASPWRREHGGRWDVGPHVLSR